MRMRLGTKLHVRWIALAVVLVGAVGCGTTQSQLATQQLLLSDAADRAVANIDFRPLSGKKLYLDERYVQTVRPQNAVGYVNAEYILSSIRQQMLAADCHLEDKPDTADYIVEIRIGTLGTDAHDVTYGLPPNNTLNTAVNVVPNAPSLPALPELSFAKRTDQLGAAKIAVFAYDRETRMPVWQSGTSLAMSNAKNVWILGVGPFQRGTIYNKTRFAGEKIGLPLLADSAAEEHQNEKISDYNRPKVFAPELTIEEGLQVSPDEVQLSSFLEQNAATANGETSEGAAPVVSSESAGNAEAAAGAAPVVDAPAAP